MAIILLVCRPCVVIVDYWDMLFLGRAPRTKETLPNFCEWCLVTRHLRVSHGLTGCQRTPRFWGVTRNATLDHLQSTLRNVALMLSI